MDRVPGAAAVIALRDATTASCGGKAGPLGELLRAGFRVPSGFVVRSGYVVPECCVAPECCVEPPLSLADGGMRDALQIALNDLLHDAPTPYVAVRSSSTTEDGSERSAAGQHETFLAIKGADAVYEAVLACVRSLHTTRATAYRGQAPEGAMHVLVQRFIDADVSGVCFTDVGSTIEACHGLGEPLVQGAVTPERWEVSDHGAACFPGRQHTRLDRVGDDVVTTPYPPRPCLTPEQAQWVHHLGLRIRRYLGYPVDVEWALRDDALWVLQARPVTAALPPSPETTSEPHLVHGTPASPGVAAGPVTVVRRPSDFHRFSRGDVLVCATTDPAWTPLLTVASAVVTEHGGMLCHAAIVARELGIPAVVGLRDATATLRGRVTVDGSQGVVRPLPSPTSACEEYRER